MISASWRYSKAASPFNYSSSFAPPLCWQHLSTPVTYFSKLPGMSKLAALLWREIFRVIKGRYSGSGVSDNDAPFCFIRTFHDRVLACPGRRRYRLSDRDYDLFQPR
ncbi:hypothetical protein AM355_26670 [Klebsiella oxytoca]|nr:hypothetical protein AM355_26670 [Klebsiella oxytoca]